MANHKSAIKRHRQNERRRERNATVKSTLKTVVKKVRDAATGGKPGEAQELLKAAVSALDKAVSKGVLHRKNASRKISRLTLALKAQSPK